MPTRIVRGADDLEASVAAYIGLSCAIERLGGELVVSEREYVAIRERRLGLRIRGVEGTDQIRYSLESIDDVEAEASRG